MHGSFQMLWVTVHLVFTQIISWWLSWYPTTTGVASFEVCPGMPCMETFLLCRAWKFPVWRFEISKETSLGRIWADDVVESIECSRQGWYWKKESSCFCILQFVFPCHRIFVTSLLPELIFLLVCCMMALNTCWWETSCRFLSPWFLALESSTCSFPTHPNSNTNARFGWVGWFRCCQLLSKCWWCMWMDLWFSAFTCVFFRARCPQGFLLKLRRSSDQSRNVGSFPNPSLRAGHDIDWLCWFIRQQRGVSDILDGGSWWITGYPPTFAMTAEVLSPELLEGCTAQSSIEMTRST